MLKINLEDTNYRAKIVKLEGLRKHSNADKLQVATIDFNNVITGLEAKDGDIYVYFPLECAINKDFLAWSNSFEEKILNANVSEKGFFNKHGRVRAVKLRGEPSQGYIIPIQVLYDWIQVKIDKRLYELSTPFDPCFLNIEFDSWDDIVICQKYVPATKDNAHTGLGTGKPVINKIKDVLIDGQFNFYGDTEHFKKNGSKFKSDSLVVITQKLHGSSFIGSHVLIKRKHNFIERMLVKLGIPIPDSKYGYIWSSGKPKSKLPKGTSEGWNTPNMSFYKEDIWKIELNKIKDVIPKGWTIYGEIVGRGVQGDYIYGISLEEKTRLYVYKITVTNTDGKVSVLDWFSLKQFCERNGLYHVPELYVGKLGYKNQEFPEILEGLCKEYLEKDLPDGLPDEGITIMDLSDKEWFKLKSTKFLEYETKQLDKEIITSEEV